LRIISIYRFGRNFYFVKDSEKYVGGLSTPPTIFSLDPQVEKRFVLFIIIGFSANSEKVDFSPIFSASSFLDKTRYV